jgi:hypothetical protein
VQSGRYCFPILNRIAKSIHILAKLPHIKFNENSFSGSSSMAADRRGEANGAFFAIQLRMRQKLRVDSNYSAYFD